MKVRIVSCTNEYWWYGTRIGEVFEVLSLQKNWNVWYYRVAPNKGESLYRFIPISDCKIVEDVVSEKFEPRSGMTFETKSGRRGLFVQTDKGLIRMYTEEGDSTFTSWADTKWSESPFNNLAKVFEGMNRNGNAALRRNLYIASAQGKVLWEDCPTKEVTLEEVATKFGVPVDKIRIKD